MYIEILKNVHTTVKNINTPRLERAKEALTNAKMVIKNPNDAKIATFLMGSAVSIIMLANKVKNIIVFIPLSRPKYLPINPAIAIKIIALIAIPH
jgi:hypothetical protein